MSRTPKSPMILRVARIPWMVIFMLGMADGVIPGFGVLFFVLAVVAAMMIVFSLILRLFGWVCWRNDPGYRQFRKTKGESFLRSYFAPRHQQRRLGDPLRWSART